MRLSDPEPIRPDHDLAAFDSGREEMDGWLRRRALSNHEKGFTSVTVVHVDRRVVGFCGLAASGVAPASAPRSIRTGQPPELIPCFLIGQLATDRAWVGQGVAVGLLVDAYARCLRAAELVGARALLTHALDAEAAAFWQRRGFKPSTDEPLTLFRSLADVWLAIEHNSVSRE